MSNDELDQTLIPKDEDEKWLKVLHGEITEDVCDTQLVDANKIRSYLIARDETLAVTSIAEVDELNTISEEEARLFYHQAREEIRLRGKNTWLDAFKKYGAVFMIGGLSASVLFLLFNKEPPPSPLLQQVNNDILNYTDYKLLQFNEAPGLLPNMLLIPGGDYTAGCTDGWDSLPGGCRPSEYPAHNVSIDTFEMAQHEVTVGQFSHFVKHTQYVSDAEREGKGCVHRDTKSEGQPWVKNTDLNWKSPGYEQDDHFPVTCVSWNDTQAYLKWLSKETQTTYRLPTESEWEYAARGKQATAYFWGSFASSNQANYQGVGGQDKWEFAAPVGSFPSNQFFLQDTAGNVWEWVEDCWHKTHHDAPSDGSKWVEDCISENMRVRRGGGWDASASGIRSAIRSPGASFDRSNLYGFRVARDWQKQQQ